MGGSPSATWGAFARKEDTSALDETQGGVMMGGMRTDEEQAEMDRRSEARVAAIVTLFSDLTAREREDAISRIREGFCVHCGSDNPRCQCWNDD